MLGIAADTGNLPKIKWLIDKGSDYKWRENKNSPSITARAAYGDKNEHWEVVKWFLTKGCGQDRGKVLSKNCSGKGGEPLLHIYANKKQWMRVMWILTADADFDVNEKDHKNKRSLLSVAAEQGHSAAVSGLVKDHFAHVNSTDKYGNTPLVIAAANNHWKIVRWFLCDGKTQGISSHNEIHKESRYYQRNGYTVMAMACATGQIDMVPFLCDHECSLHEVDNEKNGAISVACMHGQLAVIQWLYENTKTKLPRDFAAIAAKYNSWSTVEWASQLEEVEINQRIESSETDELDKLDINQKGKSSPATAVLIAAKKQNWKIVEFLIVNCGANDQVMDALNYVFEQPDVDLMMRIFVSMLMDWGDDIVILKFKRVLPFFHPAYLGDSCKEYTDKSDSPITVCLSLAHVFNKLAKTNIVNKEQYINLKREFSETAKYLLGKPKSDQLAAWILEAGEDYWDPVDNTFKYEASNSALRLALQYEDIEFIGDPRVNRIIIKWWGSDKNLVKSDPKKLFVKPCIKMLLDHVFFIIFLILFLFVLIRKIPLEEPDLRMEEWFLFGYAVTYFWRELNELKLLGFKGYREEAWNKLDMSLCLSLFVCFGTRKLSYKILSQYEKFTEPIYILSMIISNTIIWLRSLSIFLCWSSVGTLLITVVKMIPQILNFLALFFVFQIMFFFSFDFLIHQKASVGVCLFANLLLSSVAQEYLELPSCKDQNPPPKGPAQYAFMLWVVLFLFFASLVLINLLIAMMARIYSKVYEKSVQEYTLLRVTQRYLTYDLSPNLLPPPFNFPVHLVYGIYLILNKLQECCSKIKKQKKNKHTIRKASLEDIRLSMIQGRQSIELNQSILMRMLDPNSGIALQERKTINGTYLQCFSGSNLVTWMVQNGIAKDRILAVEIGTKLLNSRCFNDISCQGFLDDENYFYNISEQKKQENREYCGSCHFNSKTKKVDAEVNFFFCFRSTSKPVDLNKKMAQLTDEEKYYFISNMDKLCSNCHRVKQPLTRAQYIHEIISFWIFYFFIWYPSRLVIIIIYDIPMFFFFGGGKKKKHDRKLLSAKSMKNLYKNPKNKEGTPKNKREKEEQLKSCKLHNFSSETKALMWSDYDESFFNSDIKTISGLQDWLETKFFDVEQKLTQGLKDNKPLSSPEIPKATIPNPPEQLTRQSSRHSPHIHHRSVSAMNMNLCRNLSTRSIHHSREPTRSGSFSTESNLHVTIDVDRPSNTKPAVQKLRQSISKRNYRIPKGRRRNSKRDIRNRSRLRGGKSHFSATTLPPNLDIRDLEAQWGPPKDTSTLRSHRKTRSRSRLRTEVKHPMQSLSYLEETENIP